LGSKLKHLCIVTFVHFLKIQGQDQVSNPLNFGRDVSLFDKLGFLRSNFESLPVFDLEITSAFEHRLLLTEQLLSSERVGVRLGIPNFPLLELRLVEFEQNQVFLIVERQFVEVGLAQDWR